MLGSVAPGVSGTIAALPLLSELAFSKSRWPVRALQTTGSLVAGGSHERPVMAGTGGSVLSALEARASRDPV